jgi:hypothetical protein
VNEFPHPRENDVEGLGIILRCSASATKVKAARFRALTVRRAFHINYALSGGRNPVDQSRPLSEV